MSTGLVTDRSVGISVTSVEGGEGGWHTTLRRKLPGVTLRGREICTPRQAQALRGPTAEGQ